MTSVVGIYNMALAAIGQSETVASVDENSKAARVCRTFYETSRDQFLSDFNWPFATKTVALADIGNPQPGWEFRYRYPVDCLKAREIVPEGWPWHDPLPAEHRIRFQVGYGDNGRVINTDAAGAVLRYTVAVADTEQYNALYVDALALLLATKIAMPMAVNPQMFNLVSQRYAESVQRAQVQAFSESQESGAYTPDLIRARG